MKPLHEGVSFTKIHIKSLLQHSNNHFYWNFPVGNYGMLNSISFDALMKWQFVTYIFGENMKFQTNLASNLNLSFDNNSLRYSIKFHLWFSWYDFRWGVARQKCFIYTFFYNNVVYSCIYQIFCPAVTKRHHQAVFLQ